MNKIALLHEAYNISVEMEAIEQIFNILTKYGGVPVLIDVDCDVSGLDLSMPRRLEICTSLLPCLCSRYEHLRGRMKKYSITFQNDENEKERCS